ncbi:unnamed protein product, partial [marine sediment metagenome]
SASVIYPYSEGLNSTPNLISEFELKKKYPNTYQFLHKNKEILRQRMDSRKYYAKGNNWFRHLRPGSFRYIHPTKFIVKGIEKRAKIGLLKENTAFNGANCPGIIIENLGNYNLFYFLGILNSRLISYYLRSVCPAKLGGYTRFNVQNINNSPIRSINFFNDEEKKYHDKLVTFVGKIIKLNGKRDMLPSSSSRDKIEREIQIVDENIDELVYELYGISKEEIKIIEDGI